MRKGELTKLRIIEKAAYLFNEKGYTATTMQDIMDATGLTKGALYRSFSNKDEIAIEAFQYAGQVLWQHFSAAVESQDTIIGKIVAMCDIYRDTAYNPPIQGGCPFLNTAVESDHSFPVLRDHAIGAYTQMLGFIQSLLIQGIQSGELREDMDIESTASFLFSSIEGAIMASRLTRDNRHVSHATDNIKRLLDAYKA
ncbi:TetR family transcriptional regulator [Paenibacillus cellulosilyticus]|uniref:TetR family transcriptional regulator n=1 Tax=Paenibacillus cellulosilyticus TaxID=375489 RepID=A0A2V2Z1H2_9BACL|nr:TetR/AcrR family transcriptional regulator [Paenibacillus cellulosilyticus]PWW08682.1 TetR family transcriptional regulator [Paenibacillus cellulosilyticus]QKS48248.1 TetR/AcrR family transcriptional regulator [Paenibacillus cellulosilyticus]